MKITKRQLRRLIKEEASDCLKDYRLGGLSYQGYKDCLKRFNDIESQGGYGGGGNQYPRYQRKTSYVGMEANQELIATVENALAAKPNNFLSSILTQLQGGRGLSGKQKSIVKRIISKHDPAAASLFENKARHILNLKEARMKITKRQLRRIIKEEFDTLREGNSINPRGLKTLLASLNVKGQEFKALANTLSTVYHDFEGGPQDMKDEVET